jgi:hypothetical protein
MLEDSERTQGAEDSEDSIVFERPRSFGAPKSKTHEHIPLVDGQGRHRWIRSRLCWCLPNTADECRFVASRTQCPRSPELGGSAAVRLAIPKQLWVSNPVFGRRGLGEPPATVVESQEVQEVPTKEALFSLPSAGTSALPQEFPA